MLNIKIRNIINFILLILSILAFSIYSYSAEKIKFSISTNKNEFVQYEPCIINFELKNAGTTEWQVIGGMDFLGGWIKMEISENGDEFYRYDCGANAMIDYSQKLFLKPNQLLASQIIIYPYYSVKPDYIGKEGFKIDKYRFSMPGTYKIKAYYPMEAFKDKDRKMLESNILEIHVRPWNIKEQEAFNFFKNFRDFVGAMGGSYFPKDKQKAIKDEEMFIRLYPDTIYSPYIEFNLANRYFSGLGLPGPDYIRAYELFSNLSKNAPLLLIDDALKNLAEVQIEKGKLKEAKATLEQLLKEYPKSELVPEARRIRDGLQQGYNTLQDIYSKVSSDNCIEAK